MIRILIALALICFAGAASAQTRVTPCDPVTPNNAICVTITPATLNVDGTPLTQPPIWRVEQKTGAGAYAVIATGIKTPQLYVKNLAPGDYTFRSYQSCVSIPNVINCIESGATDPSNTRNVGVPTQQPAIGVTIIAATIHANGPPTYRVVYTARPRDGEIVFAVPESMRTVFASR